MAAQPPNFIEQNTYFEPRNVLLNRNVGFPPKFGLGSDQRVKFVNAQLDPRRLVRARVSIERLPFGANSLFFPLGRGGGRQLDACCREIVAAQVSRGQKTSGDKRAQKQNEENDENKATFGKAAHALLRRRWFNPRRHRGGGAIFCCAAMSL